LLRLPVTLHADPIDRVAVVFFVVGSAVVRPSTDRSSIAFTQRRVAWTRCHGWDNDDEAKQTHRNTDCRQHDVLRKIKRDIFPRSKPYMDHGELLLPQLKHPA